MSKRGRRALTYETVKVEFEAKGYTLLETECKTAATKMRYTCPYHADRALSITYNALQQGSGCRYCSIEKRAEDAKHSFDYVKSVFEARGYNLLETEYVKATAKMRYECPHHPDRIFSISFAHLQRGHGCPQCGHESSSKIRSGAHLKPINYTKAERQEARKETSRLLNTYCYDCPNRDLP
ncbi:DUF723 domain-containing protein [Bacillus sp. FJAT-51639]|uniref:DUF723 domain-containing protein n=1 Tax=Bacillus bruguierae TaxID=3127667 RepID=A0ABU8FH51_9BACI